MLSSFSALFRCFSAYNYKFQFCNEILFQGYHSLTANTVSTKEIPGEDILTRHFMTITDQLLIENF
ncbi:hypothetical protein PROFUN_10152 [Planoprotostelium fungivorum]|uniref:Uncharacterized protein n=1 Tax=Planoprotostelium fungivorum TaxID=1890364 RepID=A0A2P6NEJ0_9EUKA|nr:hypothetical protein PROFUN_10152 [Planoprotostelium fungivorum]